MSARPRYPIGALTALLLLTLVAAGCKSNNPKTGCTVDSDCPSGQTCVNETCVDESGCQTDSDCTGGQVCLNGQCVDAPQCQTDGDCTGGQVCVNGQCVDAPQCQSDGDCTGGQVCVNGQCVDAPQCQTDGDCTGGQVCVNGQCVPSSGCQADGDCPAGQVCVNGACEAVQTGQVVLETTVGDGPNDIGTHVSEDGNPEGPMSFVVANSGEIYVLDQVNSRIQVFQDNTRTHTITLPGTTFEDIDLNAQGKIVLLDRFVYKVVALFDTDGSLLEQADLLGVGIDEGGGVTGIDSHADGVWAFVGPDQSVKITQADGTAEPDRTIIEGRLSQNDLYRFKVEMVGEVTATVKRTDVQVTAWDTFSIVFEKPIGHLTGWYMDQNNKMYVGAYLNENGDASEVVVVLSSSGQEERRIRMPSSSDAIEMFRTLRVTPDGSIYQLAIEDQHIVVRRFAQ